MASSMLAADALSASVSSEADVDKALKNALHSCANDPDFAIICDFLQKFSKDLGLDLPNFKLLLQWLTKTDEVSLKLRDLHIKLLRKTRKTVHEKNWESALSKFCFTYSAQDGWEIERFGYKNSNVKVKLRILRELLECQFERNAKFRARILTLSADSLRSKPIGRDGQGHAYWVTQDNDCNIRIYQEHLDEEIWQVVATNRDEFVNLIKRLRGSEVVQPCRDIGIVDEDTTSRNSNIDSDSAQKISPPEEREGSHEDEQKVPKLSIKIIHGKGSKESTNGKYLGKGEEELAADEDAKLLKKSTSCFKSIESDEEEFEEIEEEYDDESGSDIESEDEINDKKNLSIKTEIDQKFQKNLISKNENKKVKPLLISQNKILNNENCSSSNASKKRALEQIDLSSPHRSENQQISAVKKSRPSLLDSKRPKTANKYKDKEMGEEDYDESSEDIDEEDEVEEEDIDSVAAEEDENEEKIFEDYDDDEEVGAEIRDPIIHVIGEGSGKDCDVENVLNCLNFGLEHEDPQTVSDIIVEDVYYIFGEGSGKDCLVGSNENNENKINIAEKSISEVSKRNVENNTGNQEEKTLTEKENKTSSVMENIDCVKFKKTVANIESSNDRKNSIEDLDVKKIQYEGNSDKKGDKVEKIININEDIKLSKINGEKEFEQITELPKQKQSDAAENVSLVSGSKKLRYENFSESPDKEDQQTPRNNLSISNTDSAGIAALQQQTHANKMSALESLKKELRESKKKLLERKLPITSESTNIKNSSPTIYNRKRRLTDQQQPASTRQLNSESELELHSENTEDLSNDKEIAIDESEKFVGGKRLKMRPKQANTEFRKKIEAQKVAAIDETTSSSGGEEVLKMKKNILSKQSPNLLLITSNKNLPYYEPSDSEDCVAKGGDNCKEKEEKPKSSILNPEPPLLKKAIERSPIKVKPTLAEIIEKKLKKTPETVPNDLNAVDNSGKMKETKKSGATNPLKKTLLHQIRQVDCGENVVPRKRTNSQELNSPIKDIKSFETTTKSREENLIISTTDIKKQKITLDRQRKRRSSEETVQNESPEEPEAKKELTIVKKNIAIKSVKHTDTVKADLKHFEIQSSTLVSGRRSGRRGGVVPTYVDTLQPKRNRGSTRKEFNDCDKVIPINEQSPNFGKKLCSANKQASEEKNNSDHLPGGKTNSLPKENSRKEEEEPENSADVMEMIDVSNHKACLTKTPVKGLRKQREVDASNIIDIDCETPVRQSRRIAQQKIREEAERRKLEEIALRTMKQELKKKQKAEKQADPTVEPPSEPSSESEESDVEVKRKVLKKKCPGKNGNWSSGSEEQEEPEEDEEPPHYETDPGSPLFKSDHEFSPESDIEDESQAVPMKRARTVRKEDVEGDANTPDEEEACQKCNKSDHPEWILLCDKCDKGYHCSCLSPVLFFIPEGDWYCPPCQQEQLIKALENQLKEFDDLVENKKEEEELVKRMAEEEKVRQEREEETNKNKKDKKINTKSEIVNSSADHSQDDDEKIINSDDSKDSETKKQFGRHKNKIRLRNSKNSDKRNHRDRRHNRTRGQRNRLQKHAFDSDSDSQESSNSNSESKSNSSSTYSESDNEPIYKLRKRRQINVSYRLNEYDDLINSALRKEMDEAAGAGNLGRGKDISTIIEADKEEKARQKQIKDGKVVIKPTEEQKDDDSVKETNQNSLKIDLNEKNNDERKNVIEEDDSDAEPIMQKLKTKTSQKKKSRKLTTLDISSEDDDGSDEDFKGSSLDDEEEEDSSISASNSDSSLEIYKRHGKLKKKRRKVTRRGFRERRKDRFLADESDDEEVQRPKSKKKRKDDSDYTESEADDDDMSELSENIDSADLCDDTTTDESDGAWKPNKRKKAKKSTTSFPQKSPKSKSSHTKKHKKVEYSDDDVSESEEDEDEDDNNEIGSGKGMGKQPRSQPLKANSNTTKTKGKGKEKPPAKTTKQKKLSSEDESSKSDSEDSTRRTRGRRYAYIEDFDDDSSDGGIKPGVQRPDTPPEEREKFIKRQEEIKRMLAEKNAEGAKLAATPRLTPIKTDGERDKRSPAKAGGDSLSTVPLSVIRQAKVLDIDYLQRRGESLDDLSNEVGEVDDDFDDADLPDDLPEDMDEDAIARMVEEEEEFGVTAIRELPTPDEVLRPTNTVKITKPKEVEKASSPGSTSSSSTINTPQVTTVILPTPTSGLQEPVRKRLPMPTIHPPLLRHQFLMQDSMSNTHHLMQRHGGTPTSHLLQNALSAPFTHTLDRSYSSATPTTSHHSLINKTTHNIALPPTVSHALSTTRASQAVSHSVVTKSSHLLNQPGQEKSTNPQNVTENKPRGRRKKITPLRDTLQKQQTAAAVTAATATSSALASSLVKNNNAGNTSFLSSVIKSGSTPKLPMQASVITSMSPASHSATSRPGVPIPSITGSFIRNDGPRYYDALGNRISQTSVLRHRGPSQMPASLLPPHPANRSSYGLPPPLKGSNSGPPVSSNISGSIRNPIRHVPPPYLGMPPNARHASHLNMYSRPPIYGNHNFGPRVNLRPPNIHPTDYTPGSRAYPPYGFYPPPPPLTAPGQRSGPISVSRSSIQMPQIQSTLAHPPASVIVSTTSSKSSNTPTAAPRPTPEVNDPSSSSKSVVVTQGSQIKLSPSKSSSPTPVVGQTEKSVAAPITAAEPRKKLTTLQAYTANPAKKSPVLPSHDSSSRSPPNPPTEINDDSSAPGSSEIAHTAEQPSREEGQASEFSGLVSYFSSQHDDYNT